MKNIDKPQVIIKDPFTFKEDPTLLEGMLFVHPRRQICEKRPLIYGVFAVLSVILVVSYLLGYCGAENLAFVALLMVVLSLDFYEVQKNSRKANEDDSEEYV